MSLFKLLRKRPVTYKEKVGQSLNNVFISRYLPNLSDAYKYRNQYKDKRIITLNGYDYTLTLDDEIVKYLEELSKLHNQFEHIKKVLSLDNEYEDYVLNELFDVIPIIDAVNISLVNLVPFTDEKIHMAVHSINRRLKEIIDNYNQLNTETLAYELEISYELKIRKEIMYEELKKAFVNKES